MFRKSSHKNRNSADRITGALVILFALFFFVVSPMLQAKVSGGVTAHAAAETVTAAYEKQNVMDDLKGATIDGGKVDLTQYNFDERKNVQIISFVEFCYSPFSDKQSDYGLYVYVYNPRGLDWTKNEELNAIQLRSGGNSSAKYKKYPLQYLNRSEVAGYEGLFYKFKIELTDGEKSAILSSLNSSGRIYEVSGIELYSEGTNATEYEIANTFTYKGYAEGYGSTGVTADTLSCTCDGLMTLTLDVHSTYYRPEGSNGTNENTQDTLHSVYFSIPNKVLDEYGGLSAVHATWLNAVTNIALVTGNYEAYKSVKQFTGREVSEFAGNKELNYAFVSAFDYDWFGSGIPVAAGNIGFNYFFNASNQIKNNLNRLDYVFYAGEGENSADSYTVSSEEITVWLLEYTAAHGGELVNGKYSRALFSEVDDKFTEMNIRADDKFSLTSEKLSQNFWEKLFGGSHVVSSTTFNDIEAIHPVQKNDFKSNTSLTCKELYVAESDYKDFKAYYDKATLSNETLFLFRYQVSDYMSEEASETTNGKKANNTNAYFFQETVNLDFDIIDVTCSKGEIDTVIACISSPQDIINAATPPLDITDDTKNKSWWDKLLTAFKLIGIIVLLILFAPVILLLLRGIVWLICRVFKLIGSLFKKE